MKQQMVIVEHEGRHYGPFLGYEAQQFILALGDTPKIHMLTTCWEGQELNSPVQLKVLADDDYQGQLAVTKVDTLQLLASCSWECHFAQRDGRVFTAREIGELWENVNAISHAVASLMHNVEKVIEDPSGENLVALRKALWRNRDADDVDPHYRDRSW